MDSKMALDICKLEQDLCRCCHSEGCFKNLAEPFKSESFEEIYVDMLKECYDIEMVPIPGMMSVMTYTICEVCIMRLRDASEFKKQVLLCEERFKDLYKRNGVTATVTTVNVDVEIKEEVHDESSDEVFKEDLNQDDSDDFPLISKHEDSEVSVDIKTKKEEEEEKPVQVEVKKKRKYKKRVVKTNPVKTNPVKSKRKKGKEKTLKEEPADEDDAGKKPERARLKDGEDFRKDGDKYHCSRCGKIYVRKASLINHVKTLHFKLKRFECSICIEAFSSETILTAHKLEVHNVDQRVSCGICNRFFNAKNNLMIHIRNFHMQGEVGLRYKCEFCDFVTLRKQYLDKHMFTHKTEKNFKCKYCKKLFKRRSNMKCHERIHTGDRRKVCSECGQAFVQKASLNYHMSKYHPNVKF